MLIMMGESYAILDVEESEKEKCDADDSEIEIPDL